MKNVILFGPPGAGKGTQAERILKERDMFHMSTGDAFREAVSKGTETGRLAKEYMNRGELVPDEVVVKIVEEKIAGIDGAKGVLFDGFPRTVGQAEALDPVVDKLGRSLDSVINIKVGDEEVIGRLEGRRMCRNCNRIFHASWNPPKQKGVCDDCGGEIYQRDDDKREVIMQRLETYNGQTKPVLEYYGKKGILKEVNGVAKPDEVAKEILAIL
ncbi:MAG: adenylate kinase [bacterium]